MSKNKSSIRALVAAVALTAATSASADTLRYDGAWFAPYLAGGFTIQDSAPVRAPVTVNAGAFKMTDMSTAPTSSFMAWCVDIYHFLSPSTTYTQTSGASFYATASYKKTDLERLASYVFDTNALTNSLQSAAFQLAAWEIASDIAGTGGYNVNSGDFKVTSGDVAARSLANSWLAVVNAGTYTIDQQLSIWKQNVAGSTQDLAVFSAVTPVPEPETYAMLLAGLGLMGFVARRRQRNALA